MVLSVDGEPVTALRLHVQHCLCPYVPCNIQKGIALIVFSLWVGFFAGNRWETQRQRIARLNRRDNGRLQRMSERDRERESESEKALKLFFDASTEKKKVAEKPLGKWPLFVLNSSSSGRKLALFRRCAASNVEWNSIEHRARAQVSSVSDMPLMRN